MKLIDFNITNLYLKILILSINVLILIIKERKYISVIKIKEIRPRSPRRPLSATQNNAITPLIICCFYSYGLLHCTEAEGGGRRHDRSPKAVSTLQCHRA